MESYKKVLPSASDLLKQSIKFYKNNYKVLISIGLVTLVAGIVSSAFTVEPQTLETDASIGMAILFVILAIVGGIIQLLAQISTIKTISDIDKGNTLPSLSAIYKNSCGLFFPYIFVSILLFLCFFSSAILLIIPAIILSGYLVYSQFFLLIENKRGLTALSSSYYYMKGNWWKVFWRSAFIALCTMLIGLILLVISYLVISLRNDSFDLASFGLSIAEYSRSGGIMMNIVLTAVVGFLSYCVFTPIISIYSYLIYKNLKLAKPEPNPVTDFKKSKAWFKGLSIFGLILGIIFFGLVMLGLGLTRSKNMTISTNKNTNYSRPQFPAEVGSLPIANPTLLEQKIYANDKLGFSINLPKGWNTELGETEAEGVILIPANKEKGKAIQIQFYKTKIESDAMASVFAGKILSDKTAEEETLFSKVYIGPRLAYKITRIYKVDGQISGSVNYYLVTHESGMYAITIGLGESNMSLLPTLTDSVSTFTTLK